MVRKLEPASEPVAEPVAEPLTDDEMGMAWADGGIAYYDTPHANRVKPEKMPTLDWYRANAVRQAQLEKCCGSKIKGIK